MARTTERAADLREPVGFEWDEAKRRLVLLQRGIDFIDAAKILTGPVLEYRSDRGTEGRFVAIGGPSRGALIAIVYTMRGTTIRIITARKARKNEQNAFLHAFPDWPEERPDRLGTD